MREKRYTIFEYFIEQHDVMLLESDIDEVENLVNKKIVEERDGLKRLLEAAQKYIIESPCDPDITDEQTIAWNNYQELLKK